MWRSYISSAEKMLRSGKLYKEKAPVRNAFFGPEA